MDSPIPPPESERYEKPQPPSHAQFTHADIWKDAGSSHLTILESQNKAGTHSLLLNLVLVHQDQPPTKTADQSHPSDSTNELTLLQSRQNLESIAKERMGSNADKFLASMQSFEIAAHNRRLPDSEIAKTYDQLTRLLTSKDNPNIPLTVEQKQLLAQQILNHATTSADRIDQGYHNTCSVSDVEGRAFAQQPSEAARTIVYVSTTGSHTTHGGTHITVDAASIAPDKEARLKDNQDARDLASQIFQVTAVNDYYAKYQPNLHYEQREPDPRDPNDTGERLIDTTTGKVVAKDTNLSMDNIGKIAKDMLGHSESDYSMALYNCRHHKTPPPGALLHQIKQIMDKDMTEKERAEFIARINMTPHSS